MDAAYLRPSTASIATSTRICAVIWIIAVSRGAQQTSPIRRDGSFPLDAHLPPAGRFKLDDALWQRCRAVPDQLDKRWRDWFFALARHSAQQPLQSGVVQP